MSVPAAGGVPRAIEIREGLASFYGGFTAGSWPADGFRHECHGRSPSEFPLNARLRITDLANRRQVRVRALDRGPAAEPRGRHHHRHVPRRRRRARVQAAGRAGGPAGVGQPPIRVRAWPEGGLIHGRACYHFVFRPFPRGLRCPSRVPIVQRPRTWPFQGQNAGSNPAGDAIPVGTTRAERSRRLGRTPWSRLPTGHPRLPPQRERLEEPAQHQPGDLGVRAKFGLPGGASPL